MSGLQLNRRFYSKAEPGPCEAAGSLWTIRLDGRDLKTPARAAFAAPRAVAEAAAAEWEAQRETIAPATMPITKAVNVAIDRIPAARAEIVASIAAYGDSDLICYRAAEPETLVLRQAEAWDPLMTWSAQALGAPLTAVTGVMHHAQSETARAAFAAAVAAESDLGLAALSELTALSGSLVIGIATARGYLSAEAGWAASRIDEEHQAELWGRDAEAEAAAEVKRRDFEAAARLAALLCDEA
ncbi:MAG: ATP12 family protein [Pseudomonadota bacterium]